MLGFVLVLTAAFAGCSGGEDAATAAVASIADTTADATPDDAADTGATAGTAADDAAATTLDADEAALAFSQCMRDEGLDFPDIGVDANGNPAIRDAFAASGIDPQSQEFRDGIGACREILAGAGFGGRGGGRADDPEIQDALVEYSECLRDQGLDVGDVQLGGNGQNGGANGNNGDAAAGGEDAPPRGQGRGRFGDPSERIAENLGLDADDPEVAGALQTCGPILETALSSFGPNAEQG
jgi:hypothetical protein